MSSDVSTFSDDDSDTSQQYAGLCASDLFAQEFRTGLEDEQFKVERARTIETILYDMSYAEEARAICAHFNATDRTRTILEVPLQFQGQQEIYEQVRSQQRTCSSVGRLHFNRFWSLRCYLRDAVNGNEASAESFQDEVRGSEVGHFMQSPFWTIETNCANAKSSLTTNAYYSTTV